MCKAQLFSWQMIEPRCPLRILIALWCCWYYLFVAFTFWGKKWYVLVVFLGLRMVLVIVVAAELKEFSVESETCLHVADVGSGQGYKGRDSAAGLSWPGRRQPGTSVAVASHRVG